ncbi:MAG: TRAP transporter large permease [Desulfobacterales bacterium]
MDAVLLGVAGVVLLLVLLLAGMHVGMALILTGFFGLTTVLGPERALEMSVSAIYGKISGTALVTLPLFILVGYLASGGGISRDIYASLELLVGRFRSGLGMATVLACTAFGTVCGSSLVTAAVFAKISAPEMRARGYEKGFAYGICAAAGSIGMLIPPSILAIVYGMLSGVSIGKLLIAGIVPGILWTVLFCIAIALYPKIRPQAIRPPASTPPIPLSRKLLSLRAWWPIGVSGGIIFGGIYGGVFTPTEASAVAAFVLFVIYLYRGFFRGRDRGWSERFRELYEILNETATTSAMIFLVLGAATVFSNFTVLTGLTTRLSDYVIGMGLSPMSLVIAFALVYLLLGCFIDSISMLSITVSLFNPIVNAAGIDAIWYAVVVILAIEVGFITPPFGINLYSVLGVAEKDVEIKDLMVGTFPFLIAELLSIVIILLFPALTTYLPAFVR